MLLLFVLRSGFSSTSGWSTYVLPKCRGNRICEKLVEEALRFLEKKWYLKALIEVERENIPSRKVVLRIGFRARNIVTIVTVLGRTISFEKASAIRSS